MTKIKLLAAAAVMTSLIATPVLAQGAAETSQNTSQLKKQQMKNPNVRASDRRMNRDRDADARYDRGYDDRGYQRDTGFLPLDAAAGIVGGAVNTAGAVASAPFGGPDYADNDGYRDNDGYARRGYRDSYASVNNYPRVGAFATAPYTNPYEYNRVDTNNDGFGQGYAQRNQFVCEPGTVFTNANGIRTLCQ